MDGWDILRDVVFGRSRYLDLYEQTVLLFIFRRTRFYGKEWEFIPARHFKRGIWSATAGCVSPRLRISEKKLWEALKTLELKRIIEIDRRVARSSRYRIRASTEIRDEDIQLVIAEHQIEFMKAIIVEMKNSLTRLSEEETIMLDMWEQILAVQTKTISQVVATPPVTQQATAPVRQHNNPILLKKPNLLPASPEMRRLKILPLKSKKLPVNNG